MFSGIPLDNGEAKPAHWRRFRPFEKQFSIPVSSSRTLLTIYYNGFVGDDDDGRRIILNHYHM